MRLLEAPTAAVAFVLAACNGSETTPPPDGGPRWSLVHQDLPGALLSIWGTSESDVWAVGADAHDGSGPMVVHYDGSAWERIETGQTSGDLWWVFGFANGPIYMGGKNGMILRYQGGAFTPMTTPGNNTVFGIWGASPDDLWAVGGDGAANGFAWRLQGGAWEDEPTLPASVVAGAAIWKVYGRSADDAWLVGSEGVSFRWDGTRLAQEDTGVGSSLFTVHGNAERYASVGGFGTGVIVENDGSGWTIALAAASYPLAGVFLDAGVGGVAVGQYGSVYLRDAAGWQPVDIGLEIRQDLHAVWLDPAGGIWSVGGDTISSLGEGLMLHKGGSVVEGGI